MTVVHESVFRSKGYQLLHPKAELSRFGRALPATTIMCRGSAFWIKEVENPKAGKIRLVLNPVNVGSDQTMAILLDQLEGVVTDSKPKPYQFAGERSPHFKFERPCYIASPSGILRLVEGWQMKGFLYKPIHRPEISFPQLASYRGEGAPDTSFYFDESGQLQTLSPKTKVKGAVTFDEVVFESFYPRLLSNKLRWIAPSFGYGEFLDRPYVSTTETLRTGFAVHFIEDLKRLRGPAYIEKVLKVIADPAVKTKVIRAMYQSMGRILCEIQQQGIAMGQPHIENFSFCFDRDNPVRALEEDSRAHDFDNIVWIKDASYPAFFGSAMMDLESVSVFSFPAATDQGLEIDQPFMVEEAARSAASAYGISLDEARAIMKKHAAREKSLFHPATQAAEPMLSFFNRFFSGQQQEMEKQPPEFIQAVGNSLGLLLPLYIHQTTQGNPWMGLYPMPGRLLQAAASPAQFFTPLLLNRLLGKINADALITYEAKEVEFPKPPQRGSWGWIKGLWT